MTNGLNWAAIGAVTFGLLCFGVVYAWLIWRLGHMKEGFTSIFVALGVGITLIGAALIDPQGALVCFLCFVASGSAMIVGDIARYMLLREQERKINRSQIDRNDPA